MANSYELLSQYSPWLIIRAQWKEIGLDKLAYAIDSQLTLTTKEYTTTQILDTIRWLEILNEENPECALALASRLNMVLSRIDLESFGRWVLTGLRMYPRDHDRQLAYFQLDDPQALQALNNEAGEGSLLAALPSLSLLLHGLAGKELELQPQHQSSLYGPPLRPVLTLKNLLIPDDYTHLDGSDRYRLYRAAIAHAVAHLSYSEPSLPVQTLKPMGIAVISAIEDARVERLLKLDYPGVEGWFLEFLRRGVKPQELSFAALIGRMNLALMDTHYQDDNYWVNKARRLFETKENDLHDYDAFRELASILANDLGQMRVPFHITHYTVPESYRDDNSFLWDFTNANNPLPETISLQIKGPANQEKQEKTTRPDETTEKVCTKEIELSRHFYPEWDYKLSLMRNDWCTVIEKIPSQHARHGLNNRNKSDVKDISLLRTRSQCQTRLLRRQWEGDDIDINAAIEVMVDKRQGLSPDPRLFLRRKSEEQMSSTIVLLDLSESSNDIVGIRMESILDIEKNAALLLVQSLVKSEDRIAVHGFSSNTRVEVNYYRLLEFGTPLDTNTTEIIRSVPGRYSTRMGAALRHATSHVKLEKTNHHSILLITDGAPADVDIYDASYLIEDASAAVQECKKSGVRIFCLVLDPQAQSYVSKIFGHHNYRIVDNPISLPKQLASIYQQLVSL
jgi:nitric oxide reductase NorD protein